MPALNKPYRPAPRGFSLLELAIVLFIVSILTVGLLRPVSTLVEANEREETEVLLEEIKEALYGYVLANGHLPCPDTNDNGEAELYVANACPTNSGDLPTTTLGINGALCQDAALTRCDTWGTPFHYRITGSYADDPALTATFFLPGTCDPDPAPTQSTFALCTAGDIDVYTNDDLATRVVDDVPAIVISFGSNRNDAVLAVNGTLSADEAENTDNDASFVQKTFSRDDDQEFDDQMIWLSSSILKDRMVKVNKLP